MPDKKSTGDEAQLSADEREAFRTELLRRPGALEEFRQAVRNEYSGRGETPPTSRLAVAGAMAGGGNHRFRFAARRNQYEQEQMRIVLASTLRSNSNAIDIGAANGEVLREILRVAPNGRHIAFEPRPGAARRLTDAFPGVDVRAMALSNTNGTANFLCVKNAVAYSGLLRYTYPEYVDASEIEEITAEVGRLDDNLSAEYVPALIKIDVQGAEGLLLEGATRTLATHRPVLIFEHILKTAAVYGTTSISLHRLLCEELGYGIFDLAGDGPYSVEEFEESQMQLRWINYLACPR
jgi:FkbM family methyltransferase